MLDSKTLVLYTENIFIKFHDHIETKVCENILAKNHLKIKQKPDYARNTYFVAAPENTGLRIFEACRIIARQKGGRALSS